LALLAGIAALAITAPGAQAKGEWCNGSPYETCIRSHDDGLYLGGLEVKVWQSTAPGSTDIHVWSSDRHYDAWATNLRGSWGRTLVHWFFPRKWFLSGAKVCAQSWVDGRGGGRPCFTMRA
jgi:hypothetical protein